jgi:hypothetical protein
MFVRACVGVQVEVKEAPFADPFKNAFRQSDVAPSGPPVGRRETKAEIKARKKVRHKASRAGHTACRQTSVDDPHPLLLVVELLSR